MVLDLEADDEVQFTKFCGALGAFLECWAQRMDSVDVDLMLACGLMERAAECAGAYGLNVEDFAELATACLAFGHERMQTLRCELKEQRINEI